MNREHGDVVRRQYNPIIRSIRRLEKPVFPIERDPHPPLERAEDDASSRLRMVAIKIPP